MPIESKKWEFTKPIDDFFIFFDVTPLAFLEFWDIHCANIVRIWSFLVHILPHSNWMRIRKTPNTDTFNAVNIHSGISFS